MSLMGTSARTRSFQQSQTVNVKQMLSDQRLIVRVSYLYSALSEVQAVG